jgi:zinc transport system substrate-binding protein
MFRPSILVTLLAASIVAAAALADDPPRVIASIGPVQSLVAAVMDGVAEPAALARRGGSPHVAHLRPSEAAALVAADIVFWIGPALETYLVRPLASLDGATVIALIDSPGLTLHTAREGGDIDPHIWLDPINAAAIGHAVAETLAAADPARAAAYRANAAALGDRLARLDHDIAAMLAPVRDVAFLTFHDAYLYFERRYGLAGIGAVAVRVGQPQSARHVAALRTRIREDSVRCLFTEPEFAPALVDTLIEDAQVTVATLDPLGSAVPQGPEAYANMLRADAQTIADCLSN